MKSKDARGNGDYDIFPALKHGQINVSTTYPGVIRAFHRHFKQEDNWYILGGSYEIVLAKERAHDSDDVKVYYLTAGESIRIERGWWHGFRVLGQTPGMLLYWTTEKYNASDPDEDRVRYDRFYNWETKFF